MNMLLYRPEVEVGNWGDIIQFYNKVFIGFIKDFVTRFSSNDDVSKSSSQDILSLSVSNITPSPLSLFFSLSLPFTPHSSLLKVKALSSPCHQEANNVTLQLQVVQEPPLPLTGAQLRFTSEDLQPAGICEFSISLSFVLLPT